MATFFIKEKDWCTPFWVYTLVPLLTWPIKNIKIRKWCGLLKKKKRRMIKKGKNRSEKQNQLIFCLLRDLCSPPSLCPWHLLPLSDLWPPSPPSLRSPTAISSQSPTAALSLTVSSPSAIQPSPSAIQPWP